MPNQYKPDLVGAPNSMSPHLRFGCLSIRKFYWDIHDIFAKVFCSSQNHYLYSFRMMESDEEVTNCKKIIK